MSLVKTLANLTSPITTKENLARRRAHVPGRRLRTLHSRQTAWSGETAGVVAGVAAVWAAPVRSASVRRPGNDRQTYPPPHQNCLRQKALRSVQTPLPPPPPLPPLAQCEQEPRRPLPVQGRPRSWQAANAADARAHAESGTTHSLASRVSRCNMNRMCQLRAWGPIQTHLRSMRSRRLSTS